MKVISATAKNNIYCQHSHYFSNYSKFVFRVCSNKIGKRIGYPASTSSAREIRIIPISKISVHILFLTFFLIDKCCIWR